MKTSWDFVWHTRFDSVCTAKTENSIWWQHKWTEWQETDTDVLLAEQTAPKLSCPFLCFWNFFFFFFYTYCSRECVVILNCMAHKCTEQGRETGLIKAFYSFFFFFFCRIPKVEWPHTPTQQLGKKYETHYRHLMENTFSKSVFFFLKSDRLLKICRRSF